MATAGQNILSVVPELVPGNPFFWGRAVFIRTAFSCIAAVFGEGFPAPGLSGASRKSDWIAAALTAAAVVKQSKQACGNFRREIETVPRSEGRGPW
jgi:hypothetical protein